MDDDGTQANRELRDGGTERGSSQTHGAGDASGVDAEARSPALRLGDHDDYDELEHPRPGHADEPPTPPSGAHPA